MDKRYFTCPPSSAVFVGLDKLRPREVSDSKSSERDENAQANFKSRLEKKGKSEQSPRERIKQELEIEQRVVTFIEDRPARGTVRYIGQEEYGSGNMRTIVGLELVGNPHYNFCIENIKITFLNFLVASQKKKTILAKLTVMC